ncbi:MAG: MazG nucleotide pyrophosphohydrolase domain-containing protein [Thermodesulfovibrionales bacterium]|nr:MazG nucleotide pyrophosphohydrolase domain-containing protein [Thermodesulfovibrionales bacterium]
MGFQELLNIMEKLRGERGCPWDKEQTRESLKPFILEEAYEFIEAIDQGEPEKMMEELGDLLLRQVFSRNLTAFLDLCFNKIAFKDGPVRPEGRGGSPSCENLKT